MLCPGDWSMSGPKVLVIDDDRDTLALYTTALRLSGFDVLAAENGVQGLRLVDDETPDAVVVPGHGDDVESSTDETGSGPAQSSTAVAVARHAAWSPGGSPQSRWASAGPGCSA